MKKDRSIFAITAACAITLTACIVFSLLFNTEDASAIVLPSDISESFALDEITYLVCSGILEPSVVNDEVLFFPKSDTTREYFICALVKLLETDVSKYANEDMNIADENDISEKYRPFVRAALAAGIVSPILHNGENYIFPNEPITREEAADIIGSLSSAVIATTRSEDFSDLDSAETQYLNNIKKLIDLEVLIGYPDSTIKPKNFLTREEFALILYRMAQNSTFNKTD